MAKTLGLLVIVCLFCCDQVAGDLAATQVAANDVLNAYKTSTIASFSSLFTSQRNRIANPLIRAGNTFLGLANNYLAAAQTFPYYSILSSEEQQLLADNLKSLLYCIVQTQNYLISNMNYYYNFNNTNGPDNTTPGQNAFSNISLAFMDISVAINSATNETCLNALKLSSSKIKSTFASSVTSINSCIATSTSQYTTSLAEMKTQYSISTSQLSSNLTKIKSCASTSGDLTSCATTITTALNCQAWNNGCPICDALSNLIFNDSNNVLYNAISQNKANLTACFADTSSEISTSAGNLVTQIQTCGPPPT